MILQDVACIMNIVGHFLSDCSRIFIFPRNLFKSRKGFSDIIAMRIWISVKYFFVSYCRPIGFWTRLLIIQNNFGPLRRRKIVQRGIGMFKVIYILFIFLLTASGLSANDIKDDSNCSCSCHKKVSKEIRKRYFPETGKELGERRCGFPGCEIHEVGGGELLGCEAKLCCGVVAKNTSYYVPASFCRCSIAACLGCSKGKNENRRYWGLSICGAGIVTSLTRAALSCFSSSKAPSCCCTSEECCHTMGTCCRGIGSCCKVFCKCLGDCAEACEDVDCEGFDGGGGD